MKRIIVCLIAVFLLLPFVYGGCGEDGGESKVVKLYGTTLGNDTLGESVLVVISPETGAFMNTVGPVGYYVNGLEYNMVNDTLYATTSTKDPVFPNGLIEIDMMTGISTTIGSGAGSQINNPTVNSAGEIFAWSTLDPSLLTVDPASGVATKVGDLGTILTPGGSGLAFDNTDNLYLVTYRASIYTLDAATGAATYFSDIPGTSIAHHGDFHPEANLYWGLSPDPWDWQSDPSRALLVIDVNIPAIIDSLSTVDFLHAITFYYD